MLKAWSTIEGVPYFFFKVICQIWRSHRTKDHQFWPELSVSRLWLGVFICRWLSNDVQSLKQHRRGALLYFKIILQISRSHEKKTLIVIQIGYFRTVTPVRIHWWLWNDAQSLKQYRRDALMFFKVICHFSRSHGTKNRRFWPELSVSGL